MGPLGSDEPLRNPGKQRMRDPVAVKEEISLLGEGNRGNASSGLA